jgi:hypothetical protein
VQKRSETTHAQCNFWNCNNPTVHGVSGASHAVCSVRVSGDTTTSSGVTPFSSAPTRAWDNAHRVWWCESGEQQRPYGICYQQPVQRYSFVSNQLNVLHKSVDLLFPVTDKPLGPVRLCRDGTAVCVGVGIFVGRWVDVITSACSMCPTLELRLQGKRKRTSWHCFTPCGVKWESVNLQPINNKVKRKQAFDQ